MDSDSTSGTWVHIGNLDDIPREGARIVRTGGGNIAVFRTADNELFALEDRCPHLGGPLSEGLVHAARVTCPLHNWVIDLATGGVVGPDEGCTMRVPVRREGEAIFLDIAAFDDRDANTVAAA